MEFKTLGDLAVHMATLPTQHAHALQVGLEKCVALLEKTAREEIGKYQPGVGPFDAWATLADSTEQDKAAHGYPVDAPLLRTEEMRDSFEHEVDGLEAVAGSKDPKIVYHEFGTPKMPPRPVFGPAWYRNKDYVLKLLGKHAVSGLIGGDSVHPSLGYGGNTDIA